MSLAYNLPADILQQILEVYSGTIDDIRAMTDDELLSLCELLGIHLPDRPDTPTYPESDEQEDMDLAELTEDFLTKELVPFVMTTPSGRVYSFDGDEFHEFTLPEPPEFIPSDDPVQDLDQWYLHAPTIKVGEAYPEPVLGYEPVDGDDTTVTLFTEMTVAELKDRVNLAKVPTMDIMDNGGITRYIKGHVDFPHPPRGTKSVFDSFWEFASVVLYRVYTTGQPLFTNPYEWRLWALYCWTLYQEAEGDKTGKPLFPRIDLADPLRELNRYSTQPVDSATIEFHDQELQPNEIIPEIIAKIFPLSDEVALNVSVTDVLAETKMSDTLINLLDRFRKLVPVVQRQLEWTYHSNSAYVNNLLRSTAPRKLLKLVLEEYNVHEDSVRVNSIVQATVDVLTGNRIDVPLAR